MEEDADVDEDVERCARMRSHNNFFFLFCTGSCKPAAAATTPLSPACYSIWVVGSAVKNHPSPVGPFHAVPLRLPPLLLHQECGPCLHQSHLRIYHRAAALRVMRGTGGDPDKIRENMKRELENRDFLALQVRPPVHP